MSFQILDNLPLRAYRHTSKTSSLKGQVGDNASIRVVQLALLVGGGQPGAPKHLSAER
jgi:hypothetical protein